MPRSPSRDLSDRYIGRRGYFRTPDAIRRGKYVFAVIALFAAVAWAAVDVAGPARTAYGHSHGPLTNPHAAFDDNCSACHATYSIKDFSPLTALNARERWHDLTCQKCHGGPPHHATATKKGADRHLICSNCHHDHQGRTFSLVRLNDRDCNVCHMNLDEWRDTAKIAELTEKARQSKSEYGYDGPYAAKVTHFVNDHPTFRALEGTEGESKGPPKNKPRTLTFSHAVHMNPGQAYGPDGKEAMTARKLRELAGGKEKGDAAVAKYAPGAADDAKIQLNCASCHVLDAGQGDPTFDARKAALAGGDPARSILPPRAEGAYFLPTNFESHCRSCHPLGAAEGTFSKGEAKLILPRFDLPHRKQPGEIRGLIEAGYVKSLIEAEGLDKVAGSQGPGLPAEVVPDAFGRRVKELTDRATGYLLTNADGGCRKCHQTTPADGGPATAIAPVPDRTVWFTHAKFNHASHRGATCASCHPGTGARSVSWQDAAKPEPVQILGRDSCRTCHSPTSSKVEVFDAEGKKVERPGGGIRSNCTDCHRYHHGDQPLQGRGADSWEPKEKRDLADWLKGK